MANGSRPLCSGSANSVGSTAATSRSSIAGRRGAATDTPEIGAELVRRKVDVIVTQGGVVGALKRVTSSVPIVFTVASDPLGSGFVTNLARPGGNVTGLSLQMTDLGGKRLQLLREAVPGLSRLGIMGDGGYPASVLEMDEVETAARALGLAAARFEIRGASDIGPTFDRLKGNVQALYVVAAPLMTTNQIRINTLAAAAQLPTMHGIRDLVTTGGLMSYGANFPDLFGRAAGYVDKNSARRQAWRPSGRAADQVRSRD